MEHALTDRRSEPRISAASIPIVQATLRPGCLVRVIDISPIGVYFESERPLRPGSRVHVRLASDHWTVVLFAHVVRCLVSELHPEDGVRYQGALHFDEPCTRLTAPCHRGAQAGDPTGHKEEHIPPFF